MAKAKTIIVSKEAWIHVKNSEREKRGFKKLSDTFIERMWTNGFRNAGANPATHPIDENEIRLCECDYHFPYVLKELEDAGFTWREDGFIQEYMNI